MRGDDGEIQWRSIRAMRPHKKFLLVWFDGVQSADDADQLIGKQVAVPRDQLPALDEGELYQVDLIGCRVFLADGNEIGAVAEVLVTGSNDVLIVRSGNREHLIPLIDDVVTEIDIEQQRITVSPMEGLLDE